jgi:hypothetical protein
MMLLLATTAGRAAMPADVDLNDVLRWEDHAEDLLDLPPGCWEWVGRAAWDWDVGRFGGSRGDAVFVGRTDDGRWGSLVLQPLGEERRDGAEPPVRVYDVREARFAPLSGSLEGARVRVASVDGRTLADAGLDENAEASNVLRKALHDLGAGSSSSWVEWDEARQGVVLHRAIDIDGGLDLAATVFFPGGGTVPTAVDLTFPETFRTGTFPRWTIRDAQVHLRGVANGGRAFPESEVFSFTFSVLGWHFRGAQTVEYRHARRCDAPAPAPAPEEAPQAPPAPE